MYIICVSVYRFSLLLSITLSSRLTNGIAFLRPTTAACNVLFFVCVCRYYWTRCIINIIIIPILPRIIINIKETSSSGQTRRKKSKFKTTPEAFSKAMCNSKDEEVLLQIQGAQACP